MTTIVAEDIESSTKKRSQLSFPEVESESSLRQSKKSKKFLAPSQRNISHTSMSPVQPCASSSVDNLDEEQARSDNVNKPDMFMQSRCEITALNNPCLQADPRYSYSTFISGASESEKDESDGKINSDYKPDTFLLSRCEISASKNPCFQPDVRYAYYTDATETTDCNQDQFGDSFASSTDTKKFDMLHSWNFGV